MNSNINIYYLNRDYRVDTLIIGYKTKFYIAKIRVQDLGTIADCRHRH